MHSSKLFFLSALIIWCGFGCKKDKKTTVPGNSVTYDFTWTSKPTGAPSYVSLYRFGFKSNAPAGSRLKWDFGDGIVSTEDTPMHDYTELKAYKVTLRINDDTAHLVSKMLEVSFYLPHSFSFTGTQLPDSMLHFYSNVPNDSTFLWDFGDGATSAKATPDHAYAATGDYNVKLTINNNSGSSYTHVVKIYKDPVYTHLLAGTRQWHDTIFLYRSDNTITPGGRPDASFEIGYVNPLVVSFGGNLNYSYSTDSTLVYGSSYIDNTSNTHSKTLYYNYLKNTVRIEKYDRISAGGATTEVWKTF